MNVLDILNSPWAITPDKLTEMCAIYVAHRAGEKSDLAAIEVALGKPLGPGGPKPYDVQDGVAIISLSGVLSKRMGLFSQISGGQSYQSFQSDLQQAVDDPDVQSIIIQVDSPGGAVDGTQAAADAVYAARESKPVCALVDGEMCSAAYWIGSSAAKSYISSDTDVVGSIGVVTQHVDTSNLEHQRGVKITDITAGKYKRIASQHAPLSPDGRNAIQEQLDHVYGVFVDAVARNRGVDADTVVNKMADGRIFRGQQAINAGLVDGKMTLPKLVQQMKSQKGSARMGAPITTPTPKGKPNMAAETETTFTSAQMETEKETARKAGFDAGLAQGRTEGATAECERIQAVEKAVLPGHEKLIASFKFDGKTTGAEAALQVVQAENTLRASKLADVRNESVKPVPESTGSAAADAAAANGEKPKVDANDLAAKASAIVTKAKAEGKTLTYAAAVQQVMAAK
jgi:capsid assembly protease